MMDDGCRRGNKLCTAVPKAISRIPTRPVCVVAPFSLSNATPPSQPVNQSSTSHLGLLFVGRRHLSVQTLCYCTLNRCLSASLATTRRRRRRRLGWVVVACRFGAKSKVWKLPVNVVNRNSHLLTSAGLNPFSGWDGIVF